MARPLDFATVRRIGLTLPGVTESTAYGSPCLKVRGKLMACIPVNKSAEPGSLVVRIDDDQRAGMIADSPDIYYVTDHYRNYSSVLVRLSRIDEAALTDLLRSAWNFATTRSPGLRHKLSA